MRTGGGVIYVEVLRDLHGVLIEYLLWYNKFHSDLEEVGFVFNTYGPCVSNQMVNEKQHAIKLHVDDPLISQINSKVNDLYEQCVWYLWVSTDNPWQGPRIYWNEPWLF